ncbi:HlyD family type I secretion periplasmic adaptor subunit [Glaciimonas sp. PAMC28666]|uniref:HlyD family type I secretion periplasmic adaptor subunit n=1 Tax=Glaciimonas sp. PAMC28666 TaxID=2807626 RepID=UPI0019639C60|nr:HlyD family type I secretion periplasmic adaptor subunit [Glaciimonas sp. PAMC28666]QRX81215.1 HlyD family type I secretion periplasmic adaptor subunit [Glaciimonas sp. PAMC28666]
MSSFSEHDANTDAIPDASANPGGNTSPADKSPLSNRSGQSDQSEIFDAAHIVALRSSDRWQDPLRLIEAEAPSQIKRLVLWTVSILILILIAWTAFGKLDIIATAEGKLVPQTLVKIVQPAEAGIVKQLLVNEGDSVKAGQLLAQLDTTLANADQAGFSMDIAIQRMQMRRIDAELADQTMLPKDGEDPQLYAQVRRQFMAHKQAFLGSLEQEKSLVIKARHDHLSALQVFNKLQQTLPIYQRSATAYAKLKKEGFVTALAADEKQRDAIEKARDLDAQQSIVASLAATIAAQEQRITQLGHTYRADLQTERADVHARLAQLQPNLDKSIYKQGLMELRAPQAGVINDLATTTIGAVVQPGTVVMTLVPQHEQLYADVSVKNEDVGFVQIGQTAQIKLAAYPFQKYGMLTGAVTRLSADASDREKSNANADGTSGDANGDDSNAATSTYKARIKLAHQILIDPQGNRLQMTAGMQVIAEIHQGKRTVFEYLLSPVQKALQEAGRER